MNVLQSSIWSPYKQHSRKGSRHDAEAGAGGKEHHTRQSTRKASELTERAVHGHATQRKQTRNPDWFWVTSFTRHLVISRASIAAVRIARAIRAVSETICGPKQHQIVRPHWHTVSNIHIIIRNTYIHLHYTPSHYTHSSHSLGYA
jgi:hypothetical protein